MSKTEACPCNKCPYDCDEDECAEYLRWEASIEEKQRNKEMSALNRKYTSALRRIDKQTSKLTELKAENKVLLKILKKHGLLEQIGELS